MEAHLSWLEEEERGFSWEFSWETFETWRVLIGDAWLGLPIGDSIEDSRLDKLEERWWWGTGELFSRKSPETVWGRLLNLLQTATWSLIKNFRMNFNFAQDCTESSQANHGFSSQPTEMSPTLCNRAIIIGTLVQLAHGKSWTVFGNWHLGSGNVLFKPTIVDHDSYHEFYGIHKICPWVL